MSRPRILANLCWMVPGGVGGSEEYTTRLLGTVAAADGADIGFDVGIAAMADVAESHPELGRLTLSEFPISGRLRSLRLLTESTWLAARSRNHDLVHHFGGRVPAVRGAPAIVTIHDIQSLDRPENFSRVKSAYLARALPRSVRAARLVVTPSEWVAARLIDRLGLDETDVRVVPSTFSRPSADQVRPPSGEGPMLLYPAMTHPHKDHRTLIEAFDRVRQRLPGARLVLTGGRGRAHDEVARRVAATPGVTHRGRVAASELAELIVQADVLAFPSRYEGFGLPVLEAMSVGTPVVAADSTALPEVVGGGGLLVEPGDVGGWADALLEVAESGLDQATAAAAAERVAHYSPERARERLLKAWGDALERG